MYFCLMNKITEHQGLPYEKNIQINFIPTIRT